MAIVTAADGHELDALRSTTPGRHEGTCGCGARNFRGE